MCRDIEFCSAQEVVAEFHRRGLPEQFCLVPFSTLLLEPDGLVGSCRHKGSQFAMDQWLDPQETFGGREWLDRVWNGSLMRQWRQEFLSGQVQLCKTEVRHRACHLCPEYNSLLSHIDLKEIQSRPPLRLGLNLNGRCNLRCRMCQVWKSSRDRYRHPVFWKWLEALAPDLKEVELLSGEPFIQKETYRLFEIFSKQNPQCRWTITTNAHWRFSKKISDWLDRIRVKNLIVSVDSLWPETYAKIRRGGELKRVLDNLDRLIAYDHSRIVRGHGSLGIRVNFLMQQDNWQELGATHRFGVAKGVETFRTFLYEPAEFSLLSLPDAAREQIVQYYLSNLSAAELKHSMRVLLPLLESVPPAARADFWLRLQGR